MPEHENAVPTKLSPPFVPHKRDYTKRKEQEAKSIELHLVSQFKMQQTDYYGSSIEDCEKETESLTAHLDLPKLILLDVCLPCQ